VNPLAGRELGIARQRLRAVIRPDGRARATAVERVELGLVWFTNGDGIAYPSLETLRARIAEDSGGRGLHRSTVARLVVGLPHYLTVGYFARTSEDGIARGALRGGAVRLLSPDVADELGFPPAVEALERLEMYRWILPPRLRESDFQRAPEGG
jgi:hypothetical protein